MCFLQSGVNLFLQNIKDLPSNILSVIAAAVSEPEASERGSSLIGKKSHYRGIESRFLAKRKELWLCANEAFRMRNGLARNFGYARMKHLGCAMDSQGILVKCKWKIWDAQ